MAWSVVVVIANIDLSQEIFAINLLKALKSSLKHCCKHVLHWLRPYGDQALHPLLPTQLSEGRLLTYIMVIHPADFLFQCICISFEL